MKIEQAYNEWASQYDTNQNKTRDLDKQVTQKVLAQYKFDSVLEIGCGTGKNTKWFVQQATSVLGVDFSKGMLDIAKQKIQNNKATFVEYDIGQPWSFIKQPVDLVSCNLVLEHIEDIEIIFHKVKQNLVSNGLFFICEYHPFKQYLGKKAQFDRGDGSTIELATFVHHFSEFLNAGKKTGFEVLEFQEWFDKDTTELPRLVSFVFKATS